MSRTEPSQADIAAFYHHALERDLLPPHAPITWADDLIVRLANPDIRIIDLSLADGQPLGELLRRLRDLFDSQTPVSILLVAALLKLKLDRHELSEAAIANELYALWHRHRLTGEVLGHEVSCIDEAFEPHMPFGTNPQQIVRDFLGRQRPMQLPPLS